MRTAHPTTYFLVMVRTQLGQVDSYKVKISDIKKLDNSEKMTQTNNDGEVGTEALNSESPTTRTPPWGTVTILEEGPRYRINRIELKPKNHISTQMHFHRSEHWIVVSGTAKVICDGKQELLMQKQSTYVPANTRHRLENPGVIPLIMIEIQNGEYLGEDDITRFPEEDAQLSSR